jgi:MFS transporter, ACS family, D-galactonate transporter
MADEATVAVPSRTHRPSLIEGLWRRQLAHYPDNGRRTMYLGIVVIASIILYYELYIQGAVATKIILQYGMTFRYFVFISVVGNAVGAFASLAAGLADRWGRANLVAYGLLLTGVLMAFGLPNASSKTEYLILFAFVSFVEGVVLVATPALIRDFSPQLGRAQAMGFWTLGPVIGSLVVTEVSSHTLTAHPDWQYQFRLCGTIGIVVFLIAVIGLRELSPKLRDQLMVSLHDRALIEARAAGVDPDLVLKNHWRQMLRFDIVGPAFAISVFLLFYYIAVGFFVVYYATNFGYSPARANSLANWYWISNAISLVTAGFLSDLLRVRKPFMVIGALMSGVGVAIFAMKATQPSTSYSTFGLLLILISAGSGLAYCGWMAAFTETVEKHNPAATATGLAVWGWTIRMVVTVSLIGLTFAVSAANVLVDNGPTAQAILAKYPTQVATLQLIDPATSAALSANPNDRAAQLKAASELSKIPLPIVTQVAAIQSKFPSEVATLQAIDPTTLAALHANENNVSAIKKAVADVSAHFKISTAAATTRLLAVRAKLTTADTNLLFSYGNTLNAAAARLLVASKVPKADLAYLQKYGNAVLQAQKNSPHQWQRWWWICFVGQILFLPFVFLLTGRWSPRRARQDAEAHDKDVQREMQELAPV